MHFLNIVMRHLEVWDRLDNGRWWIWPVGGITFDGVRSLFAVTDSATWAGVVNAGWAGFFAGCFGLWRLGFAIYNSNQEDKRRSDQRIAEEIESAKIRLDEARRASFARVPEIVLVHPAEPQPITPTVKQEVNP